MKPVPWRVKMEVSCDRKKCSRGDSCTFAHDEWQLRGKPDLAGRISDRSRAGLWVSFTGFLRVEHGHHGHHGSGRYKALPILCCRATLSLWFQMHSFPWSFRFCTWFTGQPGGDSSCGSPGPSGHPGLLSPILWFMVHHQIFLCFHCCAMQYFCR